VVKDVPIHPILGVPSCLACGRAIIAHPRDYECLRELNRMLFQERRRQETRSQTERSIEKKPPTLDELRAPATTTCCENERRTIDGGCANCDAPAI